MFLVQHDWVTPRAQPGRILLANGGPGFLLVEQHAGDPMGSDVPVGRKSCPANALSIDCDLMNTGHFSKADHNASTRENVRADCSV